MLKRTTCLIFGLFFVAMSGVAQNQKVVDSLERVLTTMTGSDRRGPLIDLAIEFVDKNNDRALAFIEQAHSTALASGDSLWIVKCLRIKGQILSRLRRFDDAVRALSLALKITERNGLEDERLDVLIPYANILTYESQYDMALQFYSAAHELAIANADTVRTQSILNNLGVIYFKLKDYLKALQIWQSVIPLQPPRSLFSSMTLMNISLAYANLQDYGNARLSLDQAVVACGDQCGPIQLVHIHYASGVIFLGLKDYEKAERAFLNSYELSKRTNDIRMLLDNIYLLADIYQRKGRLDLALAYLKKAEAVINQGAVFNLEITKIYQRLSEVYLEQNKYKKAAHYQAKYISLKDSIYNEELTTSLMKAEADHLERYNQAQIASQKEMLVLKEEVIERQQTLTVVAILLAVFILMCSVVIYRNYRLKQLMNLSLEALIKARTHELEQSRSELLVALKERDVLLGRAEKEIRETMRTIKGLCHTGREESNGVTDSYLERIEGTCGRLTMDLGLLFAGAKMEERN